MAKLLAEYAVLLYQARMASGYETRLQATAKSACCSIEQLGRYERGERLPKIETAACLALAYRCEEVLTKRVELAKKKAASSAATLKADMKKTTNTYYSTRRCLDETGLCEV